MELVQVLDKNLAKKFLEVPLTIYKNDSNFIRPLDKDVNDVFDQKKKTKHFVLVNVPGGF